MSESSTNPQPPHKFWFARLRWIVALAFLVVVVWLVVHELGSFDLPAMQRTLLRVPNGEALALAAFALATVTFTGVTDVVIARWLGIKLPLRDLVKLAFVANAMANTLNLSGAVGSGVRLLGYTAHQVPMARTTALIGLQVLSLPLGLSLLVMFALGFDALPVTPGVTTHWLALAILAAAALYLPVYYVLTLRRAVMRWLPAGQPLPPLRLKLQLTVLSFLDWVLAAAVLYACLYVSGVHAKPGALLGSFAGASILGLASMIPGGLGVFDGLMLLGLTSAGHDQGAVLSGLFLFRIVYYLLPLLTGLYLGSGLLAQRLPVLARTAGRLRANPVFGLLGLPISLLGDLGMRVLAALTFLAGVVLLGSAAIPAVHEHINDVHRFLPLAAVESSYWLSILAGVLLLGLGRGIDGRLRVAYRVALPLLVIGAALAITKGLHYGESLFLLAVAIALRMHKAQFTRRAMSLTSATTLGWYAGLFMVVLAFFAIGVWSVLGADSFDPFRFGLEGHPTRLGRGLLAAALGLVIYLIWQSLAVKRVPLALPDHAELERARALYLEHGGGEFGHLSFMGDKHLFWSADSHAVVAYGAVRDRLVALGSPCGSDAAIKRAVLDFRRFADAQDRVPVFYEVLEPQLSLYHDLGFDLFKLGELALVQLGGFSLAGKRWGDLRQAVNRAARENLSFQMVHAPFDTVLMVELETVSDAWLADKRAHEKGFSLGRFDPQYLGWGPLALVRRDERLVAFANVLPPYGPGGAASIDLMRHGADAPRGSMDFLFANLLQWAHDQDYATFSLGMAPLSRVGDNPYARLNERLAALAFQYGGRFYNYQGLRRYKDKFNPEWVGSYLAYPRGVWVPGLLVDVAALVAGGYRRFVFGGRS